MIERKVTLINRPEKGCYANPAWILQFGAYGCLHLLCYAYSLEDALDECVDWIAENEPGFLMNDAVHAEYERTRAEFPEMSETMAMREAEVDMTCAAGNYIASWEWAVGLEDPTPKQIADYVHGR